MELHEGVTLIQHESLRANGPQVWADLGCGAGFFTEALATLLPQDSTIYAVDKSFALPARSVTPNGVAIQPLQLDFVCNDLPFAPLDGILMANSLHYVKEQLAFIRKARRHLKTEHSFLIVEYEMSRPTTWAPYPLSYGALQRLFEQAGYQAIGKLRERPPVRGFNKMYSALITHRAR